MLVGDAQAFDEPLSDVGQGAGVPLR